MISFSILTSRKSQLTFKFFFFLILGRGFMAAVTSIFRGSPSPITSPDSSKESPLHQKQTGTHQVQLFYHHHWMFFYAFQNDQANMAWFTSTRDKMNQNDFFSRTQCAQSDWPNPGLRFVFKNVEANFKGDYSFVSL